MKDEHSYQIKQVPYNDKMPIRIYPWGSQLTDVYTPKAYIQFKIEERMRKIDDLMIKYLDNYLRKRIKLQNELTQVYSKTKNIGHFELISSFTPEERKEYYRLCQESKKRLLARSVKQ